MTRLRTTPTLIGAAVSALMLAGAPAHAQTAATSNAPAATPSVAPSADPAADAARQAMREQLKRELLVELRAQMTEEIRREVMAELKSQMTEEVKRQVLADLTGASAPAAAATPGAAPTPAAATASAETPAPAPQAKAGAGEAASARVVRVPYVPESMRRELREQLKQEVLAQAKEEHWGNPGALPDWLDRFRFYGDLRLREDVARLDNQNTAPGYGYISSVGTGLTRAADIASNASLNSFSNTNTQENFNRSRLRLRVGADVKIADTASGGFRISTGSTSGPTSTNQTMGQGFNKYTLVLDRGYLNLTPNPWLTLSGGRIANPFFSTDLVWADDLGFEGIAANYTRAISPSLTGFATAGWFPLRTDNPLQTRSRDLVGGQVGLLWHFAPTADLKLGLALYSYHGLDGRLENDTTYTSAADYGVRYEYPDGMRQRGNTLFIENASTDTSLRTFWGLASSFRELNLTGSIDLARFDPSHVIFTADYVKNLAFDRSKIAQRTGVKVVDGKDYGYQAKLSVGQPEMLRLGDWNLSLAYRWLGSDAVLDAYTNSDFGLGGTNNKGYILGANYGLDKNTWVSARWLASQLIDSMAPKIQGTATAPTRLKVDLFQVDLNAKF